MAAAGVATRSILRLEDGPWRGAALQLAVAFPGGVGRPVEGQPSVVEHRRARAQLGIEAGAQLDHRADPALGDGRAFARLQHARDGLEERALPGPVVTDQRDGVARRDLQRDVAQRPEFLRRTQVAEAVRHRLLQRGDLLAVDAITDADVLEDDLPVAHAFTDDGCDAARAG